MKTFYLFGEDCVDTFTNEGIDALIQDITNDEFTGVIHTHNTMEHEPHDLLQAFSGYRDWAILTDLEHEQIKEAICGF